MRYVALPLAALLLSGCVNHAQVEAQNDQRCQTYGAKPGADAYLKCRIEVDKMASQERAARLGSGPDMCVRNGNVVSCM